MRGPAWRRWHGAVGVLLIASACRSGNSASSGVVVREVLRGQDAVETQNSGSAQVAPTPADIPTTLGTTVVSDTPAAIYRQAQERSRRTVDTDNLRHTLKLLGEAVEQS